MNANKLVARMVEHGISKSVLAEKLGISVSALYNKLGGKSAFTQREISMISQELSLSKDEIVGIFFEDAVS